MIYIQIITSNEDARKIFNECGIQTVERHLDGCPNNVVLGYYPCNNPPTVGIQFELANNTSSSSPVFNIGPKSFRAGHNGGNNCTSVLVSGYEDSPGYISTWLVGQAWFQGKYVDMNSEGLSLGVATLKDTRG
jgi:hypothetical protein